MFAKANYQYHIETQGQALQLMAELFDAGVLKSTLSKTYHGIRADTIRQAHADVEADRMIGKVVVSGGFN